MQSAIKFYTIFFVNSVFRKNSFKRTLGLKFLQKQELKNNLRLKLFQNINNIIQ